MISWDLLSLSFIAAMCVIADFLPKEMRKLVNSISSGEQDSSIVVMKIANTDMNFYVLKLFEISSKLFAGVRKLFFYKFFVQFSFFQVVSLIAEFVIIYVQFNMKNFEEWVKHKKLFEAGLYWIFLQLLTQTSVAKYCFKVTQIIKKL